MSERDLLSVAKELEMALVSDCNFEELDFRSHLLPAAIIGYFPQALSDSRATRLRPLFDDLGARCTGFWVGQIAIHYGLDPEPLQQLWRLADMDRENIVIRRIRAASDQVASIAILRQYLGEDFLRADFIYAEKFSGVVPEHRYLALKHDFVRTWLIGNLPIPSDQFPDDEQIAAIGAVTGTTQVTARAGSGKTTTLIRRTYFLMRHCKVPPEQILLLAFNRSAVLDVRQKLLAILCPAAESTVSNELRARERSIKKPLDRQVAAVDSAVRIHAVAMPNVMTFHALAYGLVNPAGSLLVDSEGDGDFGLSRALQRVIDDHLRDRAWQRRIQALMLAHFRNDWERIERGGFDLQDRGALLEHRRSLPRETLQGEYVKSYGEKVIADFLFEHGVPYKYERNHRWSGFNYRPDFTLFRQAGRNASGVIIEYFGLQRDPDYDEQSERKRKYWAGKPSWDFLEFSPADIAREGLAAFHARLRAALVPLGFPCAPLSEDELWEKVKDRAIDRFTKAIVSFVGRCRTRLVMPEDLDALSESHISLTEAEAQFVPLARQFYGEYLCALLDSDDFNGVMQRAIASIRAGRTMVRRGQAVVCDLSRVRYISVDEFQDFSELFYQLVNAIRQAGENVHCFCVGDDWQAINGFAGSDLQYFQKFSKYMGASSQLAISTNYRSSESVVAAGNALMDGQGKPARARSGAHQGSILVASMDDFDATLLEQQRHSGDDITPALMRIAASSIEAGRSVVVLCRTRSIPWYVNWEDLKQSLLAYQTRLRSFLPEDRRSMISVSTAHKFKGLERDDVILIDAVRRCYPLVHPDWVFTRILGVNVDEVVAEERRLFYVAVTRAKGSVILFTDNRNESPFLTDLKDRMAVTTVVWGEYPPCALTSERVVVSITNRSGYRIPNDEGGADVPTYVLREPLKLSGYKFKSGEAKAWEKTLSSEGFSISMLCDEMWVRDASGVDVTVRDGNDRVIEKWTVDDGMFRQVVG